MNRAFRSTAVVLAGILLVLASLRANAAPSPTPETDPKVAAALESKASIEFRMVPLKDVVRYLSLQRQVRILLEPEVENGITITFSAANIKLADALDKMLPPQRLKWSIEGPAIVIKPKDEK